MIHETIYRHNEYYRFFSDDDEPDRPMAPQKLPLSDPNWWSNFQQLLDDNNEWPVHYLFKFIVPKAGLSELEALFSDHSIDVKASSKGNYLSLTMHIRVENSDEVVAIYRAAGEVEGVIAL